MRKVMSRRVLYLALLAMPFLLTNSHAAQYKVVDLGWSHLADVVATDINNNGQVVGYTGIAVLRRDALFGYKDGAHEGWHTDPWVWDAASGRQSISDPVAFAGGGSAYSINDAGQVVGNLRQTAFSAEQGYVWTKNGGLQFITPPNGGAMLPYGINNSGVIVGSASGRTLDEVPVDFAYAATWTKRDGYTFYPSKNMVNGITPYGSTGSAINSQGVVVGDMGFWVPGAGHASMAGVSSFSETSGLPRAPELMNGLGVADGGWLSHAASINDMNSVVGNSATENVEQWRAMVWLRKSPLDAQLPSPQYQDLQPINLGTFGGDNSVARDINNANQVVGAANYSANSPLSAFIWSEGQQGLTDLNTQIDDKTWHLSQATAINDKGWIVGVGIHETGDVFSSWGYSSFLLVPVPEPEAYALMLAGLGLIGLAARRRAELSAA